MPTPPFPEAVLLDVGGVFHLPGHDEIAAVYRDLGHEVDRSDLNYAHYVGATHFHSDLDLDNDDVYIWGRYLNAHAETLGVPDDVRPGLMRDLGRAFVAMSAWSHQIKGSVDGARELKATGVRLGIVSNADGTVAAVLAESETAHVGPGNGVEVEVIIDSGVVGVSKPDPKIFEIALDAMGLDAASTWYVGDMPYFDVNGARAAGLFPILMDPFDLHPDVDVTRVKSLFDVADLARAARSELDS